MLRKKLDEALMKTKELINQARDTVNPNWKLYAVVADEVEFWQGDSERKHMKVKYQRKSKHWGHRCCGLD